MWGSALLSIGFKFMYGILIRFKIALKLEG